MVLVYCSFRGMAHSIRVLLTYLEVEFINVHLESLDQYEGQFSEGMIEKIRSIEGNRNKIPMLLHEGREFCTPVPIFEYLCLRFEREDLLGKNMQQRVVV